MDYRDYLDKNDRPSSEKLKRVEIPESMSWCQSKSEMIYCYKFNITKQKTCLCGNPLNYVKWGRGYNKYCSKSCSANDPVLRQNYKETCQKRYGVDHVFQSKEAKETSKKTCLERHGVEFSSQSVQMKESSKKTCLEKYGVEYTNQIPEVRAKMVKSQVVTLADHYTKMRHINCDVYLIKSKKLGLVKIGVSSDTENRLHQLKKDFSDDAKLIRRVFMDDATKTESFLHQHFSGYRKVLPKGHGRTEWFDEIIEEEAMTLFDRMEASDA